MTVFPVYTSADPQVQLLGKEIGSFFVYMIRSLHLYNRTNIGKAGS